MTSLTDLLNMGVVEARCWSEDKTGTLFNKDPQWMPAERWDGTGLPAKPGAHLITGWDIRGGTLSDGQYGATLQVHPHLWYDLRLTDRAKLVDWENIDLN